MINKLKNNPLIKKGYNERYSLLAGLCTLAVMLVVCFCYELAPFGNMTILRMDLYHQYGPLFAELSDRITSLDSLIYSWNSGGGGPFLGNFYNYLSSPTAILMLIFGHKNMPEAIAAMIITKACIASFTFSFYLNRKFKHNSPLISAFGLLYACSGYFIAYYWNLMWLDAFYLFPLVMLGIEKLITERKMKLYTVTLALTLVTNYYMGYMVCIFSVIYFLYCYFTNFDFNETYFGKLKKREKGIKGFFSWIFNNLRNSKFFDSGVRFAFTSVGAALLAAFCLVPVYFVLMNCSATSGTFPTEFKTYFSIFDFLANHLAYLNPTIRSSGEDVLPNVYCGILTLLLVPLYIFSNKISSKEKIFSVGALGIMFASFYTNYLNYIWHGFHFPNDLPYRFSFMYSFLLLIFAFKALLNIKEYTNRQIIGAGVGLTFFIIMVQEIGSKNFDETGVWICIAFIFVYCLALGTLKNKRFPYIATAALVLCSCFAEYTVANTNNYSMDQAKVNFVGDYDNFRKMKEKIDEYEGSENYRMELTALRARMDPCWYNYNGISTFSSMAYEKVSNMQSHLGMFGNYINSYTYNRQTPVYNAFFSMDYIVENDTGETTDFNKAYYKEIGKVAKYTAYENLYSLPIAFRVNPEILQWTHDNPNPFEVQDELFMNSTGMETGVFNTMSLDSIYGSGVDCNDLSYEDDGYFPYEVTGDGSNSVTMEFKVEKTGNGYLYFKSSNTDVDQITITLPDDSTVNQNVDYKPYVYDLGQLEKGDIITIYAPLNEKKDGYFYVFATTADEEVFKEGYDVLKKDSLNVTSFDDTEITGTIDVSEDGILYTSINYDTGWSVYIDGEKVAKSNIHDIGQGALLGVDITKGHHTVTLKYTPEGLILGIIISAFALVLMLLSCAIIKTGTFEFKPELYKEEDDDVPVVCEESDVNEEIVFEDLTEDVSYSQETENSEYEEVVTEEITENETEE